MQVNCTGGRYKYHYKFNSQDIPYDFEHKGLLNKLMSRNIIESKNSILQVVLCVIEESIIFITKYIKSLKNFKNYIVKNR